MKKLQSILTVLICCLMFTPAFAQVTTSSINGYVVEKGGEELVGATIVATHEPSGTRYVACVPAALTKSRFSS